MAKESGWSYRHKTTVTFRSDAKPGFVGRPLVFGLWRYGVTPE